MKRPLPAAPKGLPPGTVRFGGPIEWFSIALVFDGANLSPAEVSAAMRVELTRAREPDPSRKGPLASGQWSRTLSRKNTDEWDVGEAIRGLIDQFPDDSSAWSALPPGTQSRLSVGLSLQDWNKGLTLEPDILEWLGRHAVRLDLDIYNGEGVEGG